MAKYPEWVYKYRRPGTAVKKIGDRYYLVKSTSRRVEGKKNPQPVQEYIGVITEEQGLVETGKRKLDASDIRVWEYGFTLAARKLFEGTALTRYVAGSEEYRVAAFQQAILHLSPQSVIRKECTILEWDGNTSAVNSLVDRMRRWKMPVSFEDLLMLRSVFLVEMGEKTLVSHVGDKEREIFSALGLEVGP